MKFTVPDAEQPTTENSVFAKPVFLKKQPRILSTQKNKGGKETEDIR